MLVDACYGQSLDLLRDNSTPSGVIACARGDKADGRNYASIFGRDAAICALGMAASGEADLIEHAVQSLRTLAAFQAPNGQIPKYVKPDVVASNPANSAASSSQGEADFWYTGCIDATLWWLIALDIVGDLAEGLRARKEFAEPIARALAWLACQEHQRLYLLQQNEASDWADIMPRSGFVLYSNALWLTVKRRYGLANAEQTRYYFNYLFYPYDHDTTDNRRARVLVHYIRNKVEHRKVYLSFVNFSVWGEEIDVFGNILALLSGAADNARSREIVGALQALNVAAPYPVKVVADPIAPDDPLWRPYMQRHRQNYPWQYHNGGVWPFVGGFWVWLLARLGRAADAKQALVQLARAAQLNQWEFNEWLHGESGEPLGMAGQSWNAGMFVLAVHAVREPRRYLL